MIVLDLANDHFYLEPLEKERYSADFLVPVSTTAIQIFSFVEAPDKSHWTLATLHSLPEPDNAQRDFGDIMARYVRTAAIRLQDDAPKREGEIVG